MRTRKNKFVKFVLVSAISLSLLFVFNGKLAEKNAVNEYYVSEYYPKFKDFTNNQKMNYLDKLSDQKIRVEVDDLIKLNPSYEKKLRSRKGYTVEYTIIDLDDESNFTYSFIKISP